MVCHSFVCVLCWRVNIRFPFGETIKKACFIWSLEVQNCGRGGGGVECSELGVSGLMFSCGDLTLRASVSEFFSKLGFGDIGKKGP